MLKIDIEKVKSEELYKYLNEAFKKNGVKAMFQEELFLLMKRLNKLGSNNIPFKDIKLSCELLRMMKTDVTLILDESYNIPEIESLTKGQSYIYFIGNLASAAYFIKEISKLRDYMQIKYLNSEVTLVQRKKETGIYEYIAIGVK